MGYDMSTQPLLWRFDGLQAGVYHDSLIVSRFLLGAKSVASLLCWHVS